MYTILLIVLIFLPTRTVLHFTWPPTWCQLANTCNHTDIPECGKHDNDSQIRMFLDECDLYEYNCDNHEDYNRVDMLNCQETFMNATTDATMLVTDNTISVTPLDTTTTTSTFSTSQAPISKGCTRRNHSTVSKTESPSAVTTHLTTTLSSSTLLSTTATNEITTLPISQRTLNLSESTISEPATENSTIIFNCTRKINKTTSITETVSANNKQRTVIDTVTKTLTKLESNVDKSTMTTTVEYEEVIINATSNEYATKSDDPLTTRTVMKEKPTGATTASTDLVLCDNYPKACNRPSTWETTIKGETRDFFQILRAKFGTRIRLLRATTHWPKQAPFLIDDGTFRLGRHHESY